MPPDRAGSLRFSDPHAPRWAQVGAAFSREHHGHRLSVYRARNEAGWVVWRWSMDGQQGPGDLPSMAQAQKAAMQSAVRGRFPITKGRPRR